MNWDRRRVLRQAYRETFSGEHGEKVLADLAEEGCVMRSSYSPGDPHHTAISEGARSVVLRIFKMIDFDENRARELEARRKKQSQQEMSDE